MNSINRIKKGLFRRIIFDRLIDWIIKLVSNEKFGNYEPIDYEKYTSIETRDSKLRNYILWLNSIGRMEEARRILDIYILKLNKRFQNNKYKNQDIIDLYQSSIYSKLDIPMQELIARIRFKSLFSSFAKQLEFDINYYYGAKQESHGFNTSIDKLYGKIVNHKT